MPTVAKIARISRLTSTVMTNDEDDDVDDDESECEYISDSDGEFQLTSL